MTWYEKIIEAHVAVTDSVRHAERIGSDRYFVWMEDGRNDALADNIHAEGAVTGRSDLYTKQEFDPWVEEFEASLDRSGIAWSRVLSEYEDDTRVYHHSWDWEVA